MDARVCGSVSLYTKKQCLATCFTDSLPTHPHSTGTPTRSQGETLATLKKLVSELASLFPDEFIHLGCDETKEVGLCTLNCKAIMHHRVTLHVTAVACDVEHMLH